MSIEPDTAQPPIDTGYSSCKTSVGSAAPAPTGAIWPPADAVAMRALQSKLGDDVSIASHFGISRATVYNYRRRFGVAALPRGADRRVREKRPRARLSSPAMARLYGGRSYEDAALRRRPDNAVRGVGWVF